MFKKIKSKFASVVSTIKQKSRKLYKKTSEFVQRRPLGSFLIVLGLLLAVLILGKFFTPAETEKKTEHAVKSVKVYSIGEAPKASFQAKVEKAGVITIRAQAPGIVQGISVNEGDQIGKGGQVVSLASNYQGGNAGSVQRQIAQTQYQNTLDTFNPQKEVIQKQKDVATISAENAQQMRDISRKSVDETSSLIDANQKQLDQMKAQLSLLQTSGATGQTDAETLQTLPGTINQLQGGINQLRATQRTSDFQSSNDKAPAKLENLQKDIALKNLEVQEKGLDLSREVSRLQLSLAYINESTMYPASPFAGIVERVFVKVGQSVDPGDKLATVSSAETETTAVLTVPENIASAISLGEPSTMVVKGKTVAITPYYVSSEATDGTLYSVFYDIPKDYQGSLSDGEFITINVPINTKKTTSVDPFIPVDSVYQTQESGYVLIDNHGKAEARKVKLGSVYGNYVEVVSGLRSGDQIILDRNVVADDRVKIQ